MALLNKLSDINDMMTTTLDDYGPPTFRQAAQRYQRYELFSRWFQEEKVKSDGGMAINHRLMLTHDTDNLHTGPFSQDSLSFGDVLSNIRVEWVYMKKPWTFNYNELITNRGPALLTNIVEPRRTNVLLNFAHDIERKGWGAPSGTSDNKVPYGVSFWVVKNSAQGFNGGYPSGFTSLAGIDLNLYPNFKNYTDSYVDVSEDDLCFKLNQAKQLTDFVSPAGTGGMGDVVRDNYRLYCNNGTKLRLNKLARARNESYGLDLAYAEGGAVVHNGNPIVYVPFLDGDSSNPIYMLCHEVFKPWVQEDNFLRESEVMRWPEDHNQYCVWIDMSYNYVCEDRRRQAVLYVA